MTNLRPDQTQVHRPSLIAILRHRIAIWRARRLIDKAHRCADKALKLCPQLLREPTI